MGEYETTFAETSDLPSFIGVLDARVGPHFPTFGEFGNPVDLDDKCKLARSGNTIYIMRAEGKIEAHSWNQKRKSFFDLLVTYLSEYLELHEINLAMYSPAKVQSAKDNPSKIEDLLKKLVEESDWRVHYDVGKLFGKLLAKIDVFENHVLGVTHPDIPTEVKVGEGGGDDSPRRPDESLGEYLLRQVGETRQLGPNEIAPPFAMTIKEVVGELLNANLVRSCHYAETILQKMDDLHFVVDDGGKGDVVHDALVDALVKTRHARMCAWLAFGDVLGAHREVDDQCRDSDIATAVPRAFSLTPSDTPDTVREQIVLVEKTLAGKHELRELDVVLLLAPLTEAISRRIFSETHGSKLATVLRDRLRSERNIQKRRFASIALCLHKSYRNPSQHKVADFQCSFDEARFFTAGIRALVDLWEQIEADNDIRDS